MNEDEKREDLVKHLETLACGPPDPQPETDAALEIFDELKNEMKHWRRKWSEAEARAAGLKEEGDEFCETVKQRTKEYEEEIIRIMRERCACEFKDHEFVELCKYHGDRERTLREERDLVIEGSAEFEEECNTLRYRVKALEDDASKLSREIGTMQQHKIKPREERDHMRESRDGALEGYRLCDNRAAGYLANVIQLQTRLEEVRELYDQEHSKVDELQNDRNSWKTGYYIQKDYLALADALSDTARAACAEMSFEGTDGETRIAKTWLPVMEAEAAYRENKQSAMGPVNPVSDVRVDGKPAGGYIVTGPDGPKVKKALEEIAELADEPNPHHFAKGGVLKDPGITLIGEGGPDDVIPLPASMHSSARDDAPIQDLTEARKFDLEAAERERRIRLGMSMPDGVTGYDERCPDCVGLGEIALTRNQSAKCPRCEGKGFISVGQARPDVEPMTVVPADEPHRIEFEDEPDTVEPEPLPCGSVPCVTVPIKFPSGTARHTDDEEVVCAICGTKFRTDLVITMDAVGGPVCDACQEDEQE